MSLHTRPQSYRVIFTSALVVASLISCKSTNQNSRALSSETGSNTSKDAQANALVAEYSQSYAVLESQWIASTDRSTASGMALEEKPVKAAVAPISFSQISAKLGSVGNHLKFIISELKNPASEYHNGLKAKNIAVDPAFEKQMLEICTKAQTYVAESTRTAVSTEAYAKSWGITSLNYLPSQLKLQVDSSYQLVDTWDFQLSTIELAINAKERLSDTNDSIRSFFGSLTK